MKLWRVIFGVKLNGTIWGRLEHKPQLVMAETRAGERELILNSARWKAYWDLERRELTDAVKEGLKPYLTVVEADWLGQESFGGGQGEI